MRRVFLLPLLLGGCTVTVELGGEPRGDKWLTSTASYSDSPATVTEDSGNDTGKSSTGSGGCAAYACGPTDTGT